MNISPRNRKGFTLIELLTVIAIIGILAAVLFPGVQGVMKKAKQSAASTKLRNIAQSYITYNNGTKMIKSGAWSLTSPTSAASIGDFGAVLALNAGLNNASIWYIDADTSNDAATFATQVLTGGAGSEQIAPAFKAPSPTNGYHSWTTYVPSLKNINEQTPLIWTRGLGDTTGKWDALKGVWGAEGGHIAFGDSHIDWRADTVDAANQFNSKVTPGNSTKNWKEAVSSTAPTELTSK